MVAIKRLCIVIVNYKTPTLTVDCIDSLCNQLDHETDQIVVVDNNSGANNVSLMTAMILL